MILVIIGMLILIFACCCFIVSAFLYAKYLHLIYFKKDKQYTSFLKWFDLEYKEILK